MNQQNFNSEYAFKAFRDFFLKNLMILDFSSESLYFTKYLNRLANLKRLPKEARDLASQLEKKHKKANYSVFAKYRDNKIDEFWSNILDSDKKLNDFLARVHEQGIASYGDIVTPFTKLLRVRKDLRDVERVNEAWMTLNRIEGKPTVAYLVLNQAWLWKEELVQDLLDYIERVKCDILIIKIKNLELTDGASHVKPREMVQRILKAIAEKKNNNSELLTICLECGVHLYPFALQAFDVVSCASNMFDKEVESAGSAEEAYGGAIDEETLGKPDFAEWQRAFENHGHFVCSHE